MRVGMLQLNPVVGDLEGNLERTLAAIVTAAEQGATLVVGSEMGVLGYPPRDLLLREGVVEACELAVARLATQIPTGVHALIGLPRRAEDGSVRNSVALCGDGAIQQYFDKRLLPTYDIFDELRHFTPGDQPVSFELEGKQIGVLVCEDLWRAEDVAVERRYQDDPVALVTEVGCDLLLLCSASPFVVGKRKRHLERLHAVAELLDVPVVSVNQVGGNDDVVFAGGSAVVAPDGSVLSEAPMWEEAVAVTETTTVGTHPAQEPTQEEELFEALRLGLSDYCQKTGHRRALVGLSGGIDSAVVAAVAAAALGPENVTGVLMPSQYSSTGSLDDAYALVESLGLAEGKEIAIADLHEGVRHALQSQSVELKGLTDENIQARLRGLLLMGISNDTGAIVLATGNKSELAVGYCTLYGDMCGGVAVIGDVLKTQVYALARWMNKEHKRIGFSVPPIPVASIEKPPSAELRPDQVDTDSLPPYEILDQIVRLRIEGERSRQAIVAETGIDDALVGRFVDLIDRNEHKRHQAPIVLKVSSRTFGRGRPMPIAARWVPPSD